MMRQTKKKGGMQPPFPENGPAGSFSGRFVLVDPLLEDRVQGRFHFPETVRDLDELVELAVGNLLVRVADVLDQSLAEQVHHRAAGAGCLGGSPDRFQVFRGKEIGDPDHLFFLPETEQTHMDSSFDMLIVSLLLRSF